MRLNLKDRNTLAASLPSHAVVAEIGVENGYYTDKILYFSNPRLLVLVDAWVRLSDGKAGGVYDHDLHDASFKHVTKQYGSRPNVKIVRSFSVDAAKLFQPGTFDWIYIDADHTRVIEDITAWWPLVKTGGWITGHDYTMQGEPGKEWITVKRDLDEFVQAKKLELFVTAETDWPSWAFKKPGEQLCQL